MNLEIKIWVNSSYPKGDRKFCLKSIWNVGKSVNLMSVPSYNDYLIDLDEKDRISIDYRHKTICLPLNNNTHQKWSLQMTEEDMNLVIDSSGVIVSHFCGSCDMEKVVSGGQSVFSLTGKILNKHLTKFS